MTSPHLTLTDIQVYLPSFRPSIEQVIEDIKEDGVSFRLSAAEYRDSGFAQVPIAQDESLEQMINRVCVPILSRAREEGIRLGAILFACVTNPGVQAQSLFSGLLHEFAYGDTPVIQTEEYGCAALHLSLYLAKAYLAVEPGSNAAVLFVAADRAISSHHRSDSYMLYGDAASAALLRKSGPGGQQTLADRLKVDALVYDDSPERIKMYFSTFYLAVRQVVKQVLRDAGMSMGEIRLIFCSNLGLNTWSTLARAIGCPLDKFYAGALEYAGHLHNTDILLNVNDAIQADSLKRGDFYLTVTVGFGGYYGCSLHKYE
ncbi:3-oxoacyl-[acyl-carrier-protein] synthase-3 [Paenibacillus forsythiae]|uniref:3-oxoacyl-[acyl-carrier-protein] synthase-3 n=1 Tax=Paenibacillus forsythiae TaxID=365616 RepID=A0ABU3H613_9BACL|nr:3-oxoacyl-[acyl-carrier-protein] synthase III C-terminal domain-containing protein [Paenibacillus forsythiae]MDT3426265.1 3-oxoacyl-[acyl-carrier-protein] synthase-3 [Paenibacillus forsythiae]